MKLIETQNPKPIVRIHKKRWKEFKHNTDERQQNRREENRGNSKLQNNQKTIDRKAGSAGLSRILSVHGLNSPIRRCRVTWRIEKRDPSMCSLQDSLQIERYTDWQWGKERGILFYARKPTEMWGSNTYFKQNRL